MGGSGDPIEPRRTLKQVEARLRRAEREAINAGFRPELSNFLQSLLSTYNERDRALISGRIEGLANFVADDLETTITSLFGGSVAKHTYIDGLSDIDTLFVLREGSVDSDSPSEMLEQFANLVRTKLQNSAEVTVGEMAVTVHYSDGMELQILPAVKNQNDSLKISSASTDDWSRIAPRKFQEALTKRNEECGGKLVPTIKLAKAINAMLPEPQRVSGYHLESMAVNAFRDYSGPKIPADMLPVLFEKAKTIVLEPVKDRTGQSVHVDDYLGDANSLERQKRAGVFDRLSKRMRNATVASSIPSWSAIFGLEN